MGYMKEIRIKGFKKHIDLDMTNNGLMEKCKMSKSTIHKMENG